jgi:hypothetical protein
MNKKADKMIDEQPTSCPLCQGTEQLTQRGILMVYLLPRKIPLLLLVVGIVLGLILGRWWLAIAVIGVLIPLAGADLRLILYPVAAFAALCGKKLNCPKCNQYGGMFRHS